MKHNNKLFALLLSLLVLLALACDISVSPTAADPTSDLQGTINAAVAITETAQATVPAPTEAVPEATSTLALPPDTEVPPPTTATQEILPSPTLVVSPTEPQNLSFTEWSMQWFVPLSSGCKFRNVPCWRTMDDYQKHFGSEMILTSKTPILIESSWPSPYLVFWHKPDLKSAAGLEIELDGEWLKVRDFKKSHSDWSQVIINLSDFKGKELNVRFSADGQWGTGGVPQSLWFIQDVKVVPDYTP